MIHTIIADSTEDLDKQVNAFMTQRKQNLPVRTEVYPYDGQVWHKATVFYDEPFNQAKGTPKSDDEEVYDEMNQEEYQNSSKGKTDKLGALWLKKEGGISGKFKEENINIPENIAEELNDMSESDHLSKVIKGTPVKIIRNKFKKEPKHPDWIIFRRSK